MNHRRPTPEGDLEYTSAEGKASSVQFVHFPFTAGADRRFRKPESEAILAITHKHYGHMAVAAAGSAAGTFQGFRFNFRIRFRPALRQSARNPTSAVQAGAMRGRRIRNHRLRFLEEWLGHLRIEFRERVENGAALGGEFEPRGAAVTLGSLALDIAAIDKVLEIVGCV